MTFKHAQLLLNHTKVKVGKRSHIVTSLPSTRVEQKSFQFKPASEVLSTELSWNLQTFAQRLENLLYWMKCHFLNLVLFQLFLCIFFKRLPLYFIQCNT